MEVESFLTDNNVKYEVHTHVKTFTSQGLASVEHISGHAVAKPVVVRGAGGFSMCVIPAPKHLDLHRAAKVLGEPEARLATESEMAAIFQDCELGAEPPIGALYGLRTVIDEQLRGSKHLTIQAGSHTKSIKLSGADFERVCNGQFARIANS